MLRDFYENLRVNVLAIQNGSNDAFMDCWIAPSINLERLLQIPAWPCCVITEAGDTIDPYNGKIVRGSFDITIIDSQPVDHVGDESVLSLLDLGQLLISDLEYKTDDESIYYAASQQMGNIELEGGILIVGKSYRFVFEFERP